MKTDAGYMTPYTATIPGTDVAFEMIPIPGGQFLLGSPDDETDRAEDEGPQVRVTVEPFWIGKYEVTWSEYKQFMRLYPEFKQLEQLRTKVQSGDTENLDLPAGIEPGSELANQLLAQPSFIDGVTCPTPLYEPDATYESGDDPRQPAVTMTPYAARQYTKWLSAVTGVQYRLPGEAEWEYAARAGTTTAWHFGDDPADLDHYAWYENNSDDRSRRVGQKKPNPWGLYDMHGNVAEIVLDAYDANAYEQLQGGEPVGAERAIHWAPDEEARIVRGGSWLDEASLLRSAARLATEDADWKMSDPNLPLSPWWYTELYPAGGVGFRLVRPLAPMDATMARKVWEIEAPGIQVDVEARLGEGRGALERLSPDLPKVLDQLRQDEVQKLLE